MVTQVAIAGAAARVADQAGFQSRSLDFLVDFQAWVKWGAGPGAGCL